MPTLSRKELRIIPIARMARKSKAHSIRSSWSSQKRNNKTVTGRMKYACFIRQ